MDSVDHRTEGKLEYMERLTNVYKNVDIPGIQADIGRRLQKLCDSIEQDLRIDQQPEMGKQEAPENRAARDHSIIANALRDRLRVVERDTSLSKDDPYLSRLRYLIDLHSNLRNSDGK